MSAPGGESTTYASSGVDTAAGDRAVELMKSAVDATHGRNVLAGAGGFAGLYDASALKQFTRPLLASSTDGVGTKVAIAQALDIHDTIGYDLVGMVVDDIVVSGATPLVMTDYIACGHVVPEKIAQIVRGIAEACRVADVALVGGETAEHPGLLAPDEYDVAGAATGVVEADRLLGAEWVRTGDVLVGIESSGMHANGYSLARRIIADAGWPLDRYVAEFGRTVGEELLEPTRVYSSALLDVIENADDAVHAVSHITGGGLAANVARVVPPGLLARIDRNTWDVPAVFDVLGELGGVPSGDRERTWNLGIGMVAIVDADAVDAVIRLLDRQSLTARTLGEIVRDDETAGSTRAAKGAASGAALLIG